MNYLLNIHTTSETALINLCDGPHVVATLINTDSKQHAAFLHVAIHQILQKNDIQPGNLKAIGVTGGPGSYTGIRVGLATAKGLCFALKIPMMMFNTLEVMARPVIEKISDKNALYCPMMDARRLEVFTAVYDYQLNERMSPSAMVLTEESFGNFLLGHTVYFFGSGAKKFENIVSANHPHIAFLDEGISSTALGSFSWEKFQNNDFEDIAHSHPLYIKEFFSTAKK